MLQCTGYCIFFSLMWQKDNNSTCGLALDLEWRNYCLCRYGAYFRVLLHNWNTKPTAHAFPNTKRQNK